MIFKLKLEKGRAGMTGDKNTSQVPSSSVADLLHGLVASPYLSLQILFSHLLSKKMLI